MEILPVILAAGDDGDFVQIAVVALFLLLGLVGQIFKKKGKAQEQDQARQEAIRRERQRLEEALREKALERQQRQEGRVRPPVKHPPKLPRAATGQKRHATLGEGVQEEMAEFDRHQQADQDARRHRLHEAAPDTAAVEDLSPAPTPPAGMSIRLKGQAAQQAIIYHEIFSRCKALRTESEMWDA